MATSSINLSSIPYPLTITNRLIGIAVSAWNHDITHALLQGATESLLSAGLKESQIRTVHVPGAFELPLAAQNLFESGCDAVICLGCVIQGDTPHFDYVCKGVTDGIMQTGLKYSKPCIFGVLTTLNQEQAQARAGGSLGNKGTEAAETALWMLALRDKLNSI